MMAQLVKTLIKEILAAYRIQKRLHLIRSDTDGLHGLAGV